MQYSLCVVWFLLLLQCRSHAYTDIYVMPMPNRIDITNETVRVFSEPIVSCKSSSQCTDEAIKRVKAVLHDQLHFLGVEPKNGPQITIELEIQETSRFFPSLGDDESYSFEFNDNRFIVRANQVWGAIRSAATIAQLYTPFLSENGTIDGAELRLAKNVQDSPRYPWRGISLDLARRPYAMSTLRSVARAMGVMKMNVLRLQLGDALSWPLFAETSYRTGERVFQYTPKLLRNFVMYAAQRGIRVIPELSTPSHAAGLEAIIGKENLIMCKENGNTWMLDVKSKKVKQVVADAMQIILDSFADEYVHLGGDDINVGCPGGPKSAALEEWFSDVKKMLPDRKFIISESVAKKIPKAASDSIVHVWSERDAIKSTQEMPDVSGVVHSVYLFLDKQQPGRQSYYMWGDLIMEFYLAEPTTFSSQSGAPLLGFEMILWSDQSSDSSIGMRLFSRSTAVAERYWSSVEQNRVVGAGSIDTVAPRFDAVACKLEATGMTFSPLRPGPPCPLHWNGDDLYLE